MANWVITGGTGFLGGHLLAALSARAPIGISVFALGRRCPPGWPADAFVRADLGDREGLERTLRALRPALVFHAAGRTPPAAPEQFYRANVGGTANLLDALGRQGRPVRIVTVGSAAELGRVPVEALPVAEDRPPRPNDPYGLSKWAATALGLRARAPLDVLVARVFNPIGPGLPDSQAFGRFAALLAGPGPDPIRLDVGDLDARRDFVDVRDVARALFALAEHGRARRIYHIGTGQSRSIREGLMSLIRLSGRDAIIDERPPTPGGLRDSRADIRRIAEEAGWTPTIPWEQSLADLWDEARRRRRLPLTTPPRPHIMRPAADGPARVVGEHGGEPSR